jgi:hypothetical protein
VGQCFPQTHKQKNVQEGKKGEKGWGNKRKPSGHWGCGSRHHRTNIECTQSVLLSEMHLQIEKKQGNERSRSEEEKWIHHRTDIDHIIKQTPITSSNRHRSHHQTDTDHIIKQTPITSSNKHRHTVAQMHTPICLNANFSLYAFCLLYTGHGVANVLQL